MSVFYTSTFNGAFTTPADLDDVYVRKGIFSQGQLWAWGANDIGQLGDNTTTNRSSPVQTIAGSTNWIQPAAAISSFQNHNGAIKSDGTLWNWGTNNTYALGATSNSTSSPIQTVAGGTNWKQMSLHRFGGLAIKTDGTLWGWGENGNGELGDGTTNTRSSPVQTATGSTDWRQVSCGQSHSGAIKTDGTLWLWGFAANGRLGDNTTVSKSSPVQTVAGGTNWRQVSCGNGHTGAVKTDGTLWMWGSNGTGQIGNESFTTAFSSPVQTVSGGTDWKQVACGSFTTAAIKTNGTLWLWGQNSFGQLGNNATTDRSSPVQTVTGGANWRQVSVGYRHVGAVKTDGTLWLWGQNNSGQLGDNTTTNRSSPVQTVAGGTNWMSVATGNAVTLATITF